MTESQAGGEATEKSGRGTRRSGYVLLSFASSPPRGAGTGRNANRVETAKRRREKRQQTAQGAGRDNQERQGYRTRTEDGGTQQSAARDEPQSSKSASNTTHMAHAAGTQRGQRARARSETRGPSRQPTAARNEQRGTPGHLRHTAERAAQGDNQTGKQSKESKETAKKARNEEIHTGQDSEKGNKILAPCAPCGPAGGGPH